MKVDTLEELFLEEVRDLYDAEKQLVKALPKMAKAAADDELQQAIREHLDQTKEQVNRLEKIFEITGQRAKGKPCKGMRGLVDEGREVMDEDMEDTLHDTALIGAAQRVEHYEIAGYGAARALAQQLRMQDAAELLNETLKEETETDKRLTQIAKRLMKGSGNSSEKERAPSRAANGKGSRSSSKSRSGNGGGNMTTDHEEIRQWADERGAQPACVKGTGKKGDTGLLRFDFPGYSGAESLQPISWDDFFEKFDENGLALLYQAQTKAGKPSNFNKLVSRETSGKSGRR